MRARITTIRLTNFGKNNDDEFLVNDKQKVPPAYSRADENARSLNGPRDDDDFKFCLLSANC
jgi:hypothetical protein